MRSRIGSITNICTCRARRLRKPSQFDPFSRWRARRSALPLRGRPLAGEMQRYTAARHHGSSNNTNGLSVGPSRSGRCVAPNAGRGAAVRARRARGSSISTQQGSRRALLAARAVGRSGSVRQGGSTRNAPSCSALPCHTSWSPNSELVAPKSRGRLYN